VRSTNRIFLPPWRASGPAKQQLITGEFQHAPSKVHYRVYEDNRDAWLSFDRTSEPQLHGSRKLLYFIGSGHRGRTYLFSDDGFFFESPVNWYAQKGVWDMAPAYQKARNIPLNLPAVEACLRCHTSNPQRPLPGTENKYSLPLFAHAGITCERCHGPGGEHAVSGGAIVNPAKLSAERRDSICMQCHLEGNAAVEQPGHSLNDFQPGGRLADTVHYFVLEGGSNDGFRALSQTEALARSMCKRKSGETMSCTSCHDPHASPAPAQRVTYYREKCLSCHGAAFGAKHHVKTPDCTQCTCRAPPLPISRTRKLPTIRFRVCYALPSRRRLYIQPRRTWFVFRPAMRPIAIAIWPWLGNR
jgi:predicted CXXCH cytochrome family protein